MGSKIAFALTLNGAISLATPAAHEALVTSARGKHLCLRFCRVTVLGKYLVTEHRRKCQACQHNFDCEPPNMRSPSRQGLV
jgi:hypothetical protein